MELLPLLSPQQVGRVPVLLAVSCASFRPNPHRPGDVPHVVAHRALRLGLHELLGGNLEYPLEIRGGAEAVIVWGGFSGMLCDGSLGGGSLGSRSRIGPLLLGRDATFLLLLRTFRLPRLALRGVSLLLAERPLSRLFFLVVPFEILLLDVHLVPRGHRA